MTDKKKPEQKNDDRPIYIPPKIMRLDDMHIGVGAECPGGNSPVSASCGYGGGAGSCPVGNGGG